MYAAGRGVAQDEAQAARWYQATASEVISSRSSVFL